MHQQTLEKLKALGIDVAHPASEQEQAKLTAASSTTEALTEALWDAAVAEMGTVKPSGYTNHIVELSGPEDALDVFRAMFAAIVKPDTAPEPARFTIRRDFDCGSYCNAWSIYVVRPNGQHISHLQFSLDDEPKAQAIADAMNQALDAEITRAAKDAEAPAQTSSPLDSALASGAPLHYLVEGGA
jgi:hypothetical protein